MGRPANHSIGLLNSSCIQLEVKDANWNLFPVTVLPGGTEKPMDGLPAQHILKIRYCSIMNLSLLGIQDIVFWYTKEGVLE